MQQSHIKGNCLHSDIHVEPKIIRNMRRTYIHYYKSYKNQANGALL